MATAIVVLLCLTGCHSAEEAPASAATPTATAQPLPESPSLAELGGADPAVPGIESDSERVELALREVLATKAADYKPRTRHLRDDGEPQFVNRLIRETSPYLLQHAHNPVNWYPWSEEAFERAKAENKPVLLSVGYSTCHWCHVMEHESFEDTEIAALINQRFVAIKVDREERPDVDDVYMKAVHLLNNRGGWPMTVMLTDNKQPFFGGTYFPARDGDRGARKGFQTILIELADSYASDRDTIVTRAAELSEKIRRASLPARPGNIPGPEALAAIAARFSSSFDATWGGFGRAPKFPRPVELQFLLRAWRRSGDPKLLKMVTHTLDKIAAGGVHDHIGGGFHRYSTDQRWLVPHFEKMLYDNAQLADIYTQAWQATGDPEFEATVRDILEYVALEMTAPHGAFYSATDADNPTPEGHMEEGGFFTWTPAEVRAATDKDNAEALIAWFAISEKGNFDGRSIPFTPRGRIEVSNSLELETAELERRVEAGRADLYAVRSKRLAPLRDDKILVSWNGLMIGAFARAGLAFNEPKWIQIATRATDFILTNARDDLGQLSRTVGGQRSGALGYLDDYAYLISGLLDLYEATGDPHRLEAAIALQSALDANYLDETGGGYFTTSANAEQLIARDKPYYDGAEPSGNSVSALNLLRLEEFTQRSTYRDSAEKLLGAFAGTLGHGSTSAPLLAAALDFYSDTPAEIIIVKPTAEADDEELLNEVRRRFLPHRVLIRTVSGAATTRLAADVPLVSGKTARQGRTTGYVCEKGHCEFPTSDPAVFAKQLERVDQVENP